METAYDFTYKLKYNYSVAQVTIYLDDELLAAIKAATKASGISQSQWIADAVRVRMGSEWPVEVRQLAGAWRDFPLADEIREGFESDAPREGL